MRLQKWVEVRSCKILCATLRVLGKGRNNCMCVLNRFLCLQGTEWIMTGSWETSKTKYCRIGEAMVAWTGNEKKSSDLRSRIKALSYYMQEIRMESWMSSKMLA